MTNLLKEEYLKIYTELTNIIIDTDKHFDNNNVIIKYMSHDNKISMEYKMNKKKITVIFELAKRGIEKLVCN